MEKNDDEKQKEFINSTLIQLQENLSKFITTTNYSNIPSLYLQQQVQNYQKEFNQNNLLQIIQKKENSNNQPQIKKETILPLLLNQKNPKSSFKKETVYTYDKNNKKKKENIKNINEEFFNPSLSIKDSLLSEIKHLKNKQYLKYCNEYRNQRYYHPKYLDKEGNFIIKKEDMNQGIYDMISKGLIPKSADVTPALRVGGSPLNIKKKNVDRKNSNRIYNKGEVATGYLDKFKYNKYDVNELYSNTENLINDSRNIGVNTNKKTLEPINKDWGIRSKRTIPFYHEILQENKKNSIDNNIINNKIIINKSNIIQTQSNINEESNNNIFITGDNNNLSVISEFNNNNYNMSISEIKNKNNSSIKLNNSLSTNYNSGQNNNNQNKSNYLNTYSKTIKIEKEKEKKFTDFISDIDMTNNLEIKFISYKLIKDENYKKFISSNKEKIFEIDNIINNIGTLFKKLNILDAKIDSNKILYLLKYYNNKIENIMNKDLLDCLSNDDIIKYGFDTNDEKNLCEKIREVFIIRIQKLIRRKLAYDKYQFKKDINKKIIILQRYYRSYIIRKKVLIELKQEKEKIHSKFMDLFNELKAKWDKMQLNPRIEIHYFSMSSDCYHNCLIDKFFLKEALQLTRLIRLVDPNLEIIYILPFYLNEEILTYYISLLENLGIKNIEDRLHILIPEAAEYFPTNYNLSKLIYFSPKMIQEIKSITKIKEAYIIPGEISDIEERLSYIFEKPILMGNKTQIDLIFNKSGIKSVFELNELPFPISAWDIKTEEEFYSSLAHLIVTYPTIHIWIFKCNLEKGGRGIAYLDISNIDIINEFKEEQKINNEFTNEIYQEKLYYLLKNIIIKNVKFSFPNLYTNWGAFLQKFLSEKGIIECCPTKTLDGIMNNPCLPIFIEPGGKIKILPSYEKINVDFFKNIASTSPQNSINNAELNKIGEQFGNFLFSQEIIGYVTLEFITFHDGKKIIYWGVGMKYGLTQQISDLQFCYILYIQSHIIKKSMNYFNYLLSDEIKEESKPKSSNITNNNNNNNYINEESESHSFFYNTENCANLIDIKKYNYVLSDVMTFSFHYISTDLIKEIKLKNFLKEFRYSKLIFEVDKKEGIIFNLCDTLESGIFGICGVMNLDVIEMGNQNLRLWKMIYRVINTFKEYVYKSQKKVMMDNLNKRLLEKDRNDRIDIHDIFNKVKIVMKEKEIEKNKEDNRRKIIENTPFI